MEARTAAVELGVATEPRSAALSQIVVHAEAPLATLGDQLEGRVQRRLAEGRFGIGPAGSVSYSAERGGLALSVVGNQLVVRTPVHARAKACRGESCYASCEPEAIATAQVPLLLRPDYGFERTKVTLRFTRGCKVKALGGFLTVDVTPTLESQLEPELAKVARQIDEQLYNLRKDTDRIWKQLATPQQLPLGGCLVLQPQGIVQGPLLDSTTSVHARLALLARPELRAACTELPAALPLPALERDLAMPDEGTVELGMVTPLSGLQRALASGREIASGQSRLHVSQATVTAIGSDVAVALTLGGDLCGELAFAASPSFAKEGSFIDLIAPRWLAGERERLAAQDVDADRLLQALIGATQVPPLLSLAAFESALPAMTKLLSTPQLDLNAKVSYAHGAGAAARGDQLVAWLGMRGRLDVKAVSAPKWPPP